MTFAPAPFFFHAASVHVSEAVAGRHTPAEYSKGALAAVVVAAPDALEMWDRLGENYKRVLKIK